MTILTKLREAISRGQSCPVAPKVTLSVEHARMLEAEIIRLNARQVTDAIHRAQFEAECG